MKSARTHNALLKQLKGAAKSEFLNLVVGFKTECKFIDARDANAHETLKAMLKDGGEPIGFIDAEAKRLTIHASDRFAEKLRSAGPAAYRAGTGLN